MKGKGMFYGSIVSKFFEKNQDLIRKIYPLYWYSLLVKHEIKNEHLKIRKEKIVVIFVG